MVSVWVGVIQLGLGVSRASYLPWVCEDGSKPD